jgi:hypothetical protein
MPLARLRDRRTPTQLAVLVCFWLHHTMKGGRKKRPSLSEVANYLRPGMTRYGAQKHVWALERRGDLEQRRRWEIRGYQLTEQGRKRAKLRAEVIKRREQRKRRKVRTSA